MKTVPTAVVAVASALLTVGATELLRGEGPGAAPAEAAPPPAGASLDRSPGTAALRAPETSLTDRSDELVARLDELERRLDALELASSSRAPVVAATEAPDADDGLRDQVLEWVAEDREARGRAARVDGEERQRKELEFEARFQAYVWAQEHDLVDWQEQKLAELFLEIETRRREIERAVDPLVDDPKEVEDRWVEFDAWAEKREREVTAEVDAALYRELYGDG